MTPEGLVRNQICGWLRSKGIFCHIHDSVGIWNQSRQRFMANRNPYRMKGVADILGIWQGKFLAIEVKTPQIKRAGKIVQHKGYPSPEQVAYIEAVRKHGGIAFVARSIEDVEIGLGLKRPESPKEAQP